MSGYSFHHENTRQLYERILNLTWKYVFLLLLFQTMADPGFLRWGQKRESVNLYFDNFFKKLLKNEKKSDKRGAPPVPLRLRPQIRQWVEKGCVHSKV